MNLRYRIPSEHNPATVADGLSAVHTAAMQASTVIPIRDTVAVVHCLQRECTVVFHPKSDAVADPSILAMCQPGPLALADEFSIFAVCLAGYPRDILQWSRSEASEDAFAEQLYLGHSAADAAAHVGITPDAAQEIMQRFGLQDPDPARFSPAKLAAMAARAENGATIAQVMVEFDVLFRTVYVAIAWHGSTGLFDRVFGGRLPSPSTSRLIVDAARDRHYQVKTVAKMFGLSPDHITYLLAQEKIHPALHTYWSLPEQRAIVVNSGLYSSRKLAARYSCTDTEIVRVQKRHGIDRLGVRHWNRIYTIGNPDAFRPDSNGHFSPEAAYHLGLLMSDGCIVDKYHLRLKCAVKDRELPVQLGHFLATNSPVAHTMQPLNGKLFELVYCDVCSVALVRCLTECGMVIGAKIPQQDDIRIPASLVTSIEYVRGYFDGNGWVVRLADGTPVIGVICALRPVRVAISRFIHTHFPYLDFSWRQRQVSDPKKGFTLEILELSGWSACALSALLYLDSEGKAKVPSLNRKATMAQEHRDWTLSPDRRARSAKTEASLKTEVVPERDSVCYLATAQAEDEGVKGVNPEGPK